MPNNPPGAQPGQQPPHSRVMPNIPPPSSSSFPPFNIPFYQNPIHQHRSSPFNGVQPRLPQSQPLGSHHPGSPGQLPPLLPSVNNLLGHPPALSNAQPAASSSPLEPAHASGDGRRVEDGEEEDDRNGGGQPRRRIQKRRIGLSCTECKKRKIKCDRAQPACGACAKRGEPHRCFFEHALTGDEYPPAARSSISNASPSQPTSQIEARISHLESLISTLIPNATFPYSHPHSASQPAPNDAFTPAQQGRLSSAKAIPSEAGSNGPDSETEDAALVLEHLAMRGRDAAHGPNPHVPPLPPSKDSSRDPLELFPFGLCESIIDEEGVTQVRNSRMRDLVAELPSRERLERLINYHFAHIEWMSKTSHLPTFRKRLATFLDKSFASPSNPNPTCDPADAAFLSLVFAYLFSTVHALAFDDPSEQGAMLRAWFGERGILEYEAQGRVWYRASQRALVLGNFFNKPTLETLTTLIVMMKCSFTLAGHSLEAHMTFLSLGVRHCYLLNLMNIPDESVQPSAHGIIEREIGRRIAWEFVTLDVFAAQQNGFLMMISPSQFKTSLPLHVNDEDLVDGVPVQSKSPNVPTEMSWVIAKCQLVGILQKFTETVGAWNTPTYPVVQQTTVALYGAYDNCPPYMRDLELAWKLGRQIFFGVAMANCAYLNRLIRLNRRYLSRGYTDPQYRPSTDACLSAARSAMYIIRKAHEANWPGIKWWVVHLHIHTAAVVLCIDLLHDQPSAEEAASKRGDVEAAIAILLQNQTRHGFPSRAAKIIRALLEEIDLRADPSTPRQPLQNELPGSLKRKASEFIREEVGANRRELGREIIKRFALAVSKPPQAHQNGRSASSSSPSSPVPVPVTVSSPQMEHGGGPAAYGALPSPQLPGQPRSSAATPGSGSEFDWLLNLNLDSVPGMPSAEAAMADVAFVGGPLVPGAPGAQGFTTNGLAPVDLDSIISSLW